MDTKLETLADRCFRELLGKAYGYRELRHLDNEASASAAFDFEHFVLKLEKYRREICVTLYKAGDSNRGTNIFNLLNYLNDGNCKVVTSEYFPNETSLEECYRKQLERIAHVVREHFEEINNFFTGRDFEAECAGLNKFMLKSHPNLFKTVEPKSSNEGSEQ